ncbi:hypothetical protein TPB0596_46550 [Tsukamurella pulmonis]|uniref:Anti-sigma-M factor RsmA n=1 Tax=Tsukamurella pulmonis TaxID=47312 RepID=A0A1H1AIX6_9ACTN|nr:hypothetical protein [Tsukamurella pulmonis]KXO96000.1 hypothetical protein AXK56_00140 [Tsukamurella pulmonis]BDD84892.1 hypothetical protein TPB0596_46550 [Tsukamurella pulmonis]SDQ39491.1 hypothetical protein SAMN04489765_0241 [Tsukamurella pulmonis]SUP26585.1 Uncharacterised protein [Tsukamurella pulmonis]
MGEAGPRADDDGDERQRLSRAEEERLDAALAEYRDRMYAQWSAPEGAHADNPLGDRRIEAAIRAAPAPAPSRVRRRYLLGAAAAAVGVLAISVAVSTVRDVPAEPESGVLLAAAVPGGDRGPFTDPPALRRCLDAASVPTRQRTLLGAGSMQLRGAHTTVLLLPGGKLGELRVLAVTPSCAQGESSSVLVNRVLSGASAARAGTP